ncbi:hypothetical protein A2713_01425 [candidate division WWE3 bacterium RIFCSPHIGHO2_01_FULL_35_17]|uniref:Tagatose-bisphosphate aldolase n=1 Tax=candidate division WWE3 bacterium RIFCSPHIGHO2_01_FULL_35_17 TaxID=1802614 RepID=A0A1F4UST1_UNCKA|nr:MAG: hypothetical protein A2713_01425 [candidate division WWE3 bacterium RIFCSPHIGHO2_01_FULL_35_17]
MELSSLTNANGYIKIAAFDHRDSLQKLISKERMSEFKSLCAMLFSRYSTAILVDPEYGAEAIKIAQSQNKGILLGREKSGYTDNPNGRKTELYEKFTALKLKEMGATAIKLLIYYNDDAENANDQIELVKKVSAESKAINLPFLVEPITYPVNGHYYHKGDSIIKAVMALKDHCDILKIEYPVDPEIENTENALPYLEQISQEINIPWILLSRGMKFKNYKHALKLAKNSGCSGFAVGRAVWQEFSDFNSWEDKVKFMKTVAVDRMKELSEIWN